MDFVKHTPWLVPLILVGTVASVSVLRPTEPSRAIAQTNDKPSDTKQQQSDAKQPDGQTSAKSDQPKAKIYSPDCDKPKEHPEADLCVQRRMADAAERQNWINSWGLGGLIATVAATVLAAIAAWKTLWTMRDTAQRELRAYVTIVGGHMRPHVVNGQQGLELFIQFKNSGQTPGYRFSTWRDKRIDVAAARPFTEPPPIEQRGPTSIIGPGATVDLTTYIVPANTAAGSPLLTGGSRIFIWGQVDYLDIYEKPRHFKFKCWNSEHFTNNVWSMSPHPDGYEAD